MLAAQSLAMLVTGKYCWGMGGRESSLASMAGSKDEGDEMPKYCRIRGVMISEKQPSDMEPSTLTLCITKLCIAAFSWSPIVSVS